MRMASVWCELWVLIWAMARASAVPGVACVGMVLMARVKSRNSVL